MQHSSTWSTNANTMAHPYMHNRNSPFTTGTTGFGGSTDFGASSPAPVVGNSPFPSLTFSPLGDSAGEGESGDGGLGGSGGSESVSGGAPSPPPSPVGTPHGCCGCSAIASKIPPKKRDSSTQWEKIHLTAYAYLFRNNSARDTNNRLAA